MEQAQGTKTAKLSIRLISGKELQVNEIFLVPGDKVAEARNLQAQAAKNLGGVSTGIGFWGSPGWAIGGAVGLGLLEGLASAGAAKEGYRQLSEASALLDAARREGQFMPVALIENASIPSPDKWFVPASKERPTGLKLFGPKSEMVSCPFIHDGSAFVLAKTRDEQSLYVTISAIETYQLTKPIGLGTSVASPS